MVRKAIAWTFIGQLLSFLATFGTTVALARILSPREIGMYAIGLAVSGVLQALSAFGVGTYVVRERELTPHVVSTAFTINAVVAVLLALALIGSSFVDAITTGEPMVATVLRLLAIVPLLGAAEFRPATMLQRRMDFRVISIVTIARTVAIAIVSIAAALTGASALSAAYGAIAGAVVGAAWFTLAAREHASFRMTTIGWRSMAAFGFKTLAIGGISVLAFRMSDLVLGLILGLTMLGFFNRAAALSSVAIQNVYVSIARVLFVKLAEDQRAGRGVRVGYLQGLEMILAVMWPILAGLAVLAGPIVALLFGERWQPAAAPFAILALVHSLGLTFAMNYELFVLRDEVGRQSRYEIVRAVAGLAGFAYGCTFGLVGAAIGRVADPIVGMLIYLPQMPRLSGASMAELTRVFARNLVVALAAVAPSLVLMIHYRWSAAAPIVPLAIGVIAGIALWGVALRGFAHPLWREIAGQLARIPALRARFVS